MLDPRTYLMTEEMDSIKKIAFEDIEAYVCENYHEMLTRQYGDYMQLPPEDQRVSVHNFYKLEI
jgi:lipopolysaccharide cholinephosphotransferase